MANKLTVTLVITTYNNPSFLRLSVLSARNQTCLPDEIVIADDGSTRETFDEIAKLKNEVEIPIVHVWQEDNGFQAGKIRNVAIAAATSDYIVQIDGDIIMERHFIEDHLRFASPGAILQGSRVFIDSKMTAKLVTSKDVELSFFSKGLSRRENAFRCVSLSSYLSTRYRNRYPIYYARGANMSYYKIDFMRVNGYDEDFVGWGHEDSDLTLRMLNSGCRKLFIKFSCVAFHLYHKEASRKLEQANKDLMDTHFKNGLVLCSNGVDKYMSNICDYIQ